MLDEIRRFRLGWQWFALAALVTLFLSAGNVLTSQQRIEATFGVMLYFALLIMYWIFHDRAVVEFFAVHPSRVRGFLNSSLSRWKNYGEFEQDLHSFVAGKGVCDPLLHRAAKRSIVVACLLWVFYPVLAQYILYPVFNGVAFGLVEILNFVLIGLENLLTPVFDFFGFHTEPVDPFRHNAIG